MFAVVSWLEGSDAAGVESLWSELRSRFGLFGVYGTPIPHFAYHVSGNLQHDKACAAIERVTQELPVFTVRTSGLGIFTGPTPVLYIGIVRPAVLTELHARIWSSVEAFSPDPLDYYRADSWVPHITLAYPDLTKETLLLALDELGDRTFAWTLTVSNVSVVESDGHKIISNHRFPLS